MRHAEAEPKGAKPDEQRKLTSAGTENARRNLCIAKELGMTVDCIVSSPLVRAKETALLASEILGVKSSESLLVDSSLEPACTPYEVHAMISKLTFEKPLLLVTHQPLVSLLLSSMLGTPESGIYLDTGAIAKLQMKEKKEHEGTLLWLVA